MAAVLHRFALCLAAALLAAPSRAPAALLDLRPGPIERPMHVAVADFDRDGYDDLIVANFEAGTLHLLINQRDGTFAPHPDSPFLVGVATFSQATSGPLRVVVAELTPDDADGDGVLNSDDNCPNVPNSNQDDLVPGVCGRGTCDPRGVGLCTTGAVGDPCTIDTDCDTPDLCTAGAIGDPCTLDTDCDVGGAAGVQCRVGEDTDGDGVIDTPIDTDMDGVPDFDLVDTLDNCPRLSNPLQEDVEPAGSGICEGVCDAGGTGLCTAGTVGAPCTSDGDCNACSAGRIGDTGCSTDSDCDGDRVGDACASSPDMIILENSVGGGSTIGIVRVRVNDGSGGMLSRFSLATGVAPAWALLEDFDADGNADLLYSNRLDDELSFYPGESDGAFGAIRRIPTGEGPQGLAAGDFDHDGDLDLAVANSCDQTLGFYFNAGSGIPDEVTYVVPTSAQPAELVPGLLDGDLNDDLILLAHEAMTCSGGPRDGACCVDERDCADPDDATNDGTCTATGAGDGMVQVFTGSDSGPPILKATATQLIGPGHRPTAGLLEDLDGSGTLDLVVADFGRVDTAALPGGDPRTAGRVLIYSGAGDATFAAPLVLPDLPQPIELAAIDLDPAAPGGPDLAVLEFAANRVDLFHNDGGLVFTPAPTSPASPWRDTVSMALFGADALVGIDIVLLQGPAARLDIMSGLGTNFFSALRSDRLQGAALASGLVVTDLKEDSRPDLAVFGLGRVCSGGPQDGERCTDDEDCADPVIPANSGTCGPGAAPDAGTVTVLTNEPSGLLVERDPVAIPATVSSAAPGVVITSLDDFDRDGFADAIDNCPLRYNPAGCAVSDPACAVDVGCTGPALNPTDCVTRDPLTDQCDSDGNGIGDHCQILAGTCELLDTDADLIFDYDLNAILPGDFDRDGLLDDPSGPPATVDNCPTVSNSGQEDSNGLDDGDGVGDACEVGTDINGNGDIETGSFCSVTTGTSCTTAGDCPAGETCEAEAVDADGDGILDYLSGNPELCTGGATTNCSDNCPTVFNPGQEDNDGDRIGNACLIRAALDNCPLRRNPGQEDEDGDGVGNLCELSPVGDIVAVSPAAGRVTLLTGDGTGSLHEPSFSPVSGLANPTAAAVGGFSIDCALGLFLCSGKTTNDLAVAETVDPGNPADDQLTVYLNGDAGFLGNCDTTGVCDTGGSDTCIGGPNDGGACTTALDCIGCSAPTESLGRACTVDRDCARMPPVAAEGNPSAILTAENHPVCGNPQASDPSLRFPQENRVTLLALVQPDTSSLGIYLPSNQTLLDPAKSPLIPPPGHPAPLPVPAPLADAVFVDINADGVSDLVAASREDGDTATPNVTIYIGIGNGLFFTDPTLNPGAVPDGASRIAAGNVNLAADVFLPEVALFIENDEAPLILTNTLNERADIDGSGRVDGFDLAVLSGAFGASRGEDFTLITNPADGLLVLEQTADPDPFRRVLVAAAGPVTGQNLPDTGGFCNNALDSMKDPVTGEVRYGLAADINLDGIIDGEDLAILASRFGDRF